MWQSIDLQGPDGGLSSCLKAARVAESLIRNLMEVQKIETLRDFAETYEEPDGGTKQLDDIWKADAATKDTAVERGRLVSGWKAAAMAIKRMEESPKPEGTGGMVSDKDWEAPLPDEEREKIWSTWKSRYNVKLEAHVRPGEPLVNRIHREFHKWQTSVTDVRKWKSALLDTQPDAVVETQVTARSRLVEGLITEFRPHSIVEYYWGLRTLCNAWALCGNYLVQSVEKGAEVSVMMMLPDEALDCADRGLRLACKSAGGTSEQLDWWHRKDFLTRTIMSNYIRDKYPAGEALRQALKDTAQDWAIVMASELQGHHDTIMEASRTSPAASMPWRSHAESIDVARGEHYWVEGGHEPGSRSEALGFQTRSGRAAGKQKPGAFAERTQRSNAKGNGKGNAKVAKVGSISTKTRKGEKLCGAFNSKKGCVRDHRQCPQKALHRCGVITADDGTVCFHTNHGASTHR